MQQTKQNLICCAMPFGYGPAAKLITLAPFLRSTFNLVFVGHSIAYELVIRSRHLFDRVVLANPTEAFVKQLIRESIGLLSVEDREFARVANQLNHPLFVVDSLLWMRDCVPQDLTSAQIYWAQNFPSLNETVKTFNPKPIIVGPITAIHDQRTTSNQHGLLINLGGCQAPDNRHLIYQMYAKFILEGILTSGLLQQFSKKITITGGFECIEILGRLFPDLGIEFTSLSHEQTQIKISQAATVLTVPGMTTIMECFRQGTLTFFLPPQNYSQWCTLRHLRLQGLAPYSFHWEDILSTSTVRDRLPESERNKIVVPSIVHLTQDARAKSKFKFSAQKIALMLTTECQYLLQKQKKFFATLGGNGAGMIADSLLKTYTNGSLE
jgi:hypothetical protein